MHLMDSFSISSTYIWIKRPPSNLFVEDYLKVYLYKVEWIIIQINR